MRNDLEDSDINVQVVVEIKHVCCDSCAASAISTQRNDLLLVKAHVGSESA